MSVPTYSIGEVVNLFHTVVRVLSVGIGSSLRIGVGLGGVGPG